MKSLGVIYPSEVPTTVVDTFLSRLDNLESEEATTGGGMVHITRNSQISWVDNDKEIEELIWKYVVKANSTDFGFDIEKKYDIQFTQYIGKDNNFYGWHMDSNFNDTNMYDRKLSFVMMLSDDNEYEGGDFKFKLADDTVINCEEMRKKGSIIVFPSFVSHCVTPVISGTRKTLVAWVEGLNFR